MTVEREVNTLYKRSEIFFWAVSFYFTMQFMWENIFSSTKMKKKRPALKKN